jgi:hypothetical protein
MVKKNCEERLLKVETIIDAWFHRSLSIKGKITIINSLLISQMLYLSNVVEIPEWALNRYQNLIIRFLWNDKPAKISYKVLINDIKNGGLNLQDLRTKIKASKLAWIKKIYNPELITPWKAYLQTHFTFNI